MLGIFMIICLAVLLYLEFKKYSLLEEDYTEPVNLDNDGRIYKVCRHAIKVNTFSIIVMLIGYLGCLWPYLFVEYVSLTVYLGGIVMLGFLPMLIAAYICYLNIRDIDGYIKISSEEIEYHRHKSFLVRVSDIKKITCMGIYLYQVHLKEKSKRPLFINITNLYKKKEIRYLMKQLRDHIAKSTGRDKNLAHKLYPWKLEMFFCKYYPPFCKIIICLLLLYTSYCCIDYDFFRQDYTARFNALGADPTKPENAWPHYVQATVNYIDMEKDLQADIIKGLKPGELDLTDNQADALRKWYNENTSSWSSLQKAASINYCNATYEHISSLKSTGRKDFSSPTETTYYQILNLYKNANAGRLAGVLDLDWFDLFQMQLTSSKHFINGKTFIDQLVGYNMLARSTIMLAKQDNFKIEDLHKVRNLLKEYFSLGLPPLSIEGEVLMHCSTFESFINIKKIPVQTPLNSMFLMLGACTDAEVYTRKHYTTILEQTRKGIEVEEKEFSIIYFPIIRNMLFSILEGAVAKVYKTSQRADTYLSASYLILDLEEYKISKGGYPIDISQLREAGLTSQLPDDPYSEGKIIYINDGQKAILYSVGPNAIDDGGYKDENNTDKKNDDIIYWKRRLEKNNTN